MTWHIPAMRTMIRSLPWARHIYTLIHEHHNTCNSGLLQREDIRDAYNHLVDVLTDHAQQLRTCIPLKSSRYEKGIQISELKYYIIPIHTMSNDELLSIVTSAYRPLYNLLCDNVVPYMERIAKEQQKKLEISSLQWYRNKFIKKIMKLTARYERDTAPLRQEMEYYQNRLNQIESQ